MSPRRVWSLALALALVLALLPADLNHLGPSAATALAQEDDGELEAESGPAPAPALALPPEPLPAQDLSLPTPVEAMLENGLRVVVVPMRTLPIFTAQLVLPGGESATPANRAGLGSLTAQLLTRGTATRTAQEIALTIEQGGSVLGASATLDAVTVSAGGLIENADVALEILADVALNPAFPPEEVALAKQVALTDLRATLASPDSVVERAFRGVLYGAHPYGASSSAESLTAITRDDVQAYYASQFRPQGALLVLAGDFDAAEAVDRARAAFGAWSAPEPPAAPPAAQPPARAGRAVYLVDRPGSSQASVRIGHVLPGPIGPDRFGAEVANKVLGVGATSRLFLNLREEKGFTYDVSSQFTVSRGPARFFVAAAVRNEVTTQALTEILAELERLREQPVPPVEMDAARAFLVGSYALRLETVQAIANRVVSLSLRGLPLSDLQDYPGFVDATDQAAVQAAARRLILPDQAAIVVVGDAARIRTALEAFAPVTMVDPQGRPTPAPVPAP